MCVREHVRACVCVCVCFVLMRSLYLLVAFPFIQFVSALVGVGRTLSFIMPMSSGLNDTFTTNQSHNEGEELPVLGTCVCGRSSWNYVHRGCML